MGNFMCEAGECGAEASGLCDRHATVELRAEILQLRAVAATVADRQRRVCESYFMERLPDYEGDPLGIKKLINFACASILSAPLVAEMEQPEVCRHCHAKGFSPCQCIPGAPTTLCGHFNACDWEDGKCKRCGLTIQQYREFQLQTNENTEARDGSFRTG